MPEAKKTTWRRNLQDIGRGIVLGTLMFIHPAPAQVSQLARAAFPARPAATRQVPTPKPRLAETPKPAVPVPQTIVRTTTGKIVFPLKVQINGHERTFSNFEHYKLVVHALVEQHAQAVGLQPEIVLAHLKQESDYNPFARSETNARGLLQLMPSAVQEVKNLNLKYGIDIPSKYFDSENEQHYFDLDKNIRIGAAYIKILHRRYVPRIKDIPQNPEQKLKAGMAFFEAGPKKTWAKAKRLIEKRPYAKKVWGHYKRFQQERERE